MNYTWSSGTKVLFVSDCPSGLDFRNGYVWSDRTAHKILMEDLKLTLEECTFTALCKPMVAGFEVKKEDSDAVEQRRKWGIELLMLVDQLKPDLIACNSCYAFDLLSRTKHAGEIGKRSGLIYDVKLGGRTSKLIATTNPEFASFRSSSKEEFIAAVQSGRAATKPKRETEFTWVNDPELLVHMTDKIITMSEAGTLPFHNMVAIDIEAAARYEAEGGTGTAYSPENNIATVQIAWDLGKAMSVPLIYEGSAFNNTRNVQVFRDQLKRILDTVKVCGQNYRYDETYFRTKLGIETKHFAFDTKLAHKFLFTHLPADLSFLTSRWLAWPSHKHIIDAELSEMPKEIKSYGLLSQPVIHEYGCLDADATLQVASLLIQQLKDRDYAEFDTEILYSNAYDAFMARTMFPWDALTGMEIDGALMDVELLPVIADGLKAEMDTAFSAIQNVGAYKKWIAANTKPNPKRFKHKKKSAWKILCRVCAAESNWGWHNPEKRKPATPPDCPACTSPDVLWKRRMDNTGEKVEVMEEPKEIKTELNLSSPPQMQKFFYGNEYLGFPKHEKHGTSTGKDARAYLKTYADTHNLKEHAAVVEALGEYNGVSKLYTAYATKLGDYIWVPDEAHQISEFVTAPFERPLPINSLHARMLQDGTHSGRLSCVSRYTLITTDKGEKYVGDLLNDVSIQYHALTHKGNWKPITQLYYKGREQMFRVRMSDGGHIEATAQHQILHRGEWTTIGGLIEASGSACKVGQWEGPALTRTGGTGKVGAELEIYGVSKTGMVRLSEVLVRDQPGDLTEDREEPSQESFSCEDGEQLRILQRTYEGSTQRETAKEVSGTGDGPLLHLNQREGVGVCSEEFDEALPTGATRENLTSGSSSELPSVREIGYPVSRIGGSVSDGLFRGSCSPDQHPARHTQRDAMHAGIHPTGREGSGATLGPASEECVLVYEHLRSLAITGVGSGVFKLRKGCSIGAVLGGLPSRGEALCGGGRSLPRSGEHQDQGCKEREANGATSTQDFDKSDCHGYGRMPGRDPEVSVISIESIGSQDVWDITVADDHSYLAQGMMHHNSRDPSLHTIPRASDIKTMFVSRFGADGLIMQADQSQAEVRAFCIETLDETLKAAFVNGVDPYIGVAAKVNGIREDQVTPGQRQDTKSIVLGLLFGRGPGAIAEQTGKTYQEAVDLIANFFLGAPKVQAWVGAQHDSVHKLGLVVTRFGRVRDLKDYIWSNDSSKVNHAENISQNHPIQGLVGDLVIDSVARMRYRMKAEGLRSVLFNTVHDSTILDLYIPELFQVLTIASEELFTKLPEYFPFVNVPFAIDLDVGPSWGESVNISYEGMTITTKGKPSTSDKVRGLLSRFYAMEMTKQPVFDPEKGKVELTWNLASNAA